MSNIALENRLPAMDLTKAPAETKDVLSTLPGDVAKLRLFGVLAHAKTTLPAMLQLFGAFLNQLELPAKLRELVILQTAKLSNFEYEWIQHLPLAKAVGVTDSQIRALEARTANSKTFSEEELVVLLATEQIVSYGNVTNDLFNKLSARFSPRIIVELTELIGGYLMLAKVVAVSRLENDPPACNL